MANATPDARASPATQEATDGAVVATPDALPVGPEWVVIDASVDDPDTLIADLVRQQAAGRDLHWLQLTDGEDGIAQISQWLNQAEQPIAALHLISHGTAGELELGGTVLDIDALRARAPELAGWSAAFTAQADLLIYGCDLAATTQGVELIDALASLTGADVAASSDLTGHADLGGDWTLERETGDVEASLAFTDQAQQDWRNLLLLTPTGVETLVNTNNTGGAQRLPADSGGQQIASNNTVTVTVWQDGNAIMGRLDNLAVGASAFITVISGGGAVQDPAVAVDTTGNFVVVWSWDNQDGNGKGIFAQRFDSLGTAIGGPIQVNGVNTQNDQTLPAVTFLSNNEFAVSWTTAYTGNLDISMAVINFATGVTSSPEQIVNTTTPNDQTSSSISASGDGHIMVVWQGQDLPGAGSGWSVAGRVYSNSGAVLSPELSLASNTTGLQFAPSVDGGDTQFGVAYAHDNGSGEQRLYARVFDTLGNPYAVAEQVDESTGSNAPDRPALAMAANGNFVVSWWEDYDDIFVRDFTNLGQPASPGIPVVSNAASPQDYPTLTYVGDTVQIAWGKDGPGDNDGIFTRTFSAELPQINFWWMTAQNTTESGGKAVLQANLNTAPTANVVVNLTSSNTREGQVSAGSSLTFTPANYSTVQTIELTGIDDPIDDGDRTWKLNVSAVSSDTHYNGNFGPPFDVINQDDDSFSTITVDTNATTKNGSTASLWDLWNNRGSDGKISLTEAIEASNNSPNGAGGVDRIRFDIAAMGSNTIALLGNLPGITDAVDIDGRSDQTGTVPEIAIRNFGVASTGLYLQPAASGSSIRGLVLTGFLQDGLQVSAPGSTIEFNWVGIDLNGNIAGNWRNGIFVEASGAIIRDNVAGSNGASGIYLSNSSGTRIEGNIVGLTANEASLRGNFTYGIEAQNSSGLVIMNNVAADSSLYSGMGFANVDNSIIQHNFIGTNSTLSLAAGNRQNGIYFTNDSAQNLIGGLLGATGSANLNDGNAIAHNGWAGVQIAQGSSASLGNAIIGNLIDGNGFGIDLSPANASPSRTANDAQDTDTGVNGLQNFPIITSAMRTTPNTVSVSGNLNSTPNTRFRIDLFVDTLVTSGNGEGPTPLATLIRTTDVNGDAPFSILLSGLTGNGWITAVATRTSADGMTMYDTSEFSLPVQINNPPFWISPLTDVTIDENTPSVAILTAGDLDEPEPNLVYSVPTTTGNPPDNAFFSVINDAGTRKLVFTTGADFENAHGPDYPIRLMVTDSAGAQTTVDLTVHVNDVAEAPTAAPVTRSTTEDLRYVMQTSDFTGVFSDQDAGDSMSAIRIDTVPTAGQLQLSNGAGQTDVTPGATVTSTQLAAGQLSYLPPANATGTPLATFQFRVIDSTALLSTSAYTFSIDVVPTDDPPVLDTNTGASLAEASTVTVTATMLHTSDPDNTPDQIVYTLNVVPANGQLRLSGTNLANGATFTQADIDAGRISYAHGGGENTSDLMMFSVTSGANILVDRTFAFAITAVDDPATVTTNAVVSVAEAGLANIDGAVLSSSDPDTAPGQINYRLLNLPSQGQLLSAGLPLAVNSTFTQAQVNAGQIQYQHGGSETTSDTFGLEMTSGSHPAIALTMAVTVNPVDDQPSVTQSMIPTLLEGGTVLLSGNHLQAVDADNTAAGIVFEVVRAAVNGELRLNGALLGVADTFTQADIDAGGLSYLHSGNESTTDSVRLNLISQTHRIDGIEQTISITAANDAPVLSAPATRTGQEDQALPFGPALADMIFIDDPDPGAAATVQLSVDGGLLQLAATAGLTFTTGTGNGDSLLQFEGSLTDLRAALAGLSFTPPANASGNYSLAIMVTDSADTNATVNRTVVLSITASNDTPTVVNRVDIYLDQVRSQLLDEAHLKVVDVEDAESLIRYSIDALPAEIDLRLDNVALSIGSTFTQQDIRTGRVSVHYLGVDFGGGDLVLHAQDSSGANTGSIQLKVQAQLGAVVGAGTGSGSSLSSGGTTDDSSGARSSTATASATFVAPPDSGNTDRSNRFVVPPGDDSGIRRSSAIALPDAKGHTGLRSGPSSAARSSESSLQGSAYREGPADIDRRRGLERSLLGNADRKTRTEAMPTELRSNDTQRADFQLRTREQRAAVLREGLNGLRENIDDRVSIERNVVASSVAVTSSLSIGYVIWLLRGGVLLSSMLAAIPAWQSIDPLPVLSRFSDGGDGEDDDSLEEMLEKSRKAGRAGRPSITDNRWGPDSRPTSVPLTHPGPSTVRP